VSLFNRKTAAPANFGRPALAVEDMQATAPELVTLYKKAAVSLTKAGVSGERAAVYLVADRSGSMTPYYSSGAVQHLAEQVLGLSANLDDDGIVPLIFFDNIAHPAVEIALTAYRGVVADTHRRLGRMGSTRYDLAISAAIRRYQASGSTAPALAVFQTDGEPDPGTGHLVEDALRHYSNLPIFWQFVGFGRNFKFLRELDRLRGQVVDNAGFFAAGADPSAMPASELYDQLMGEFPHWLAAARAKGIVTT
jgi:hypothetical protein